MKCFELGEKLRRGILVAYPYVFLGHPGATPGKGEAWLHHVRNEHPEVLDHLLEFDQGEPCSICSDYRWDGWSRPASPADQPHAVLSLGDEMRTWINAELLHIDQGQPIRLTHAQLTQQLALERADMADNRALLLVYNRGQVQTRNHRARVAVDAGDQLVVFKPGGLIRVVRSGPLEGARSEFILGWDGQWMHALHETTRPSAQRVAAATQRAQVAPPVHRLIEPASPPVKVTITADDVATLGLPPGAQRINVQGVECIIWLKGNEYVGADLLSRKRKKSGIRVGGASSVEEAVRMLETEIGLTSRTT